MPKEKPDALKLKLSYASGGELGPAMRALTPKQQGFVHAMLDTGMSNFTRCAAMAGFVGTHDSLRVIGCRLAHEEKIQAAIHEEARKRIKSGAIMATSTLLTIAETQGHKDQLKAVLAILDRSGLHPTTEHIEHHHHTVDDKTEIQRIVQMAQKLGIDPRLLLGQHGVVLDADYTVVEPKQIEDQHEEDVEEPEHDPVDDLKDLL